MLVYNLGILKMESLVMWTHIFFLEIWIREDLLLVMCSLLKDVSLVGKQTCKLLLPCPLQKLSIWLFLKLAKKTVWLRELFSGSTSCTTIFCDSQSVICLTKDQMFHERMKHIDIAQI